MSEDTGKSGFSDAERRTLSSILDTLIPSRGEDDMPGAGEIGLAAHVEQALQQTPEILPLIAHGLATLDEIARGRGARDFSGLAGRDRAFALIDLAMQQPELLPALVFHTYLGYYQHDEVVEVLGLEPRPPHPEGYEVETGDLGLLDPVRQRPRLYREC